MFRGRRRRRGFSGGGDGGGNGGVVDGAVGGLADVGEIGECCVFCAVGDGLGGWAGDEAGVRGVFGSSFARIPRVAAKLLYPIVSQFLHLWRLRPDVPAITGGTRTEKTRERPIEGCVPSTRLAALTATPFPPHNDGLPTIDLAAQVNCLRPEPSS